MYALCTPHPHLHTLLMHPSCSPHPHPHTLPVHPSYAVPTHTLTPYPCTPHPHPHTLPMHPSCSPHSHPHTLPCTPHPLPTHTLTLYLCTPHAGPTTPSHLTPSHTPPHLHTLTDKLLLFFTHGSTPPLDRNRTFSEASPDTIVSTITQRSAETGNNVVISVYYTEQDVTLFRTFFFDRLPMVRMACDMHAYGTYGM